MMPIAAKFIRIMAFLAAFALPGTAVAQKADPWQIGLQNAATPLMSQINDFHNLLLIIIVAISVFVLGLLLWVMFRFNARKNPNPSRTTHNTTIEVLWTVIPVVILVVIAIPSFKLLYLSDVVPEETDMTIKATGHQWYWSYEYPDEGISFDANMVADADLKEGQLRLLETDNRVVIPVDTVVRLQVTASDVLHSWTIPSFGRKLDAVPGRLNETYIGPVTQEGVYYGQCSELCGTRHGFMPITVEVMSKKNYAEWLTRAKREFASDDSIQAPKAVASKVPSSVSDKESAVALNQAQ